MCPVRAIGEQKLIVKKQSEAALRVQLSLGKIRESSPWFVMVYFKVGTVMRLTKEVKQKQRFINGLIFIKNKSCTILKTNI